MLITFQGIKPNISKTAFIAETAVLVGDVRVGRSASIWYNAVLRADLARIEIGDYTNIQDGSVIHLEKDEPCIVGDYVTVGHGVILHGCVVEDDCLIGMHATILTGARIGKGSIIAAGALVPEGKVIPSGSLVMGVPGKIIRPVQEGDISGHESALKYAEYSKQFLQNK
jgi:carbonic anhydrase/acetyltransferase-like protein (isoleucine patch superfamily)